MPIINFTVQYDDLTNDIDDVDGDIGTASGVGRVYFETRFDRGTRIPAPGYSPRPSGFWLRTFEGYLDGDGRLKNKAGGTPGVRLWANDPVFNLDRLEYRVWAEPTDWMGRPLPFQPFSFDAPSADIAISLAEQMPKPGQKYSRGPASRIAGFNLDGDTLTLTNSDGSTVGPIDIPSGTVVLVDNEDGTWSVAG